MAIIKKRLKLEASLYTILQTVSISIFEKTPINQLLAALRQAEAETLSANQLNLFSD